MSLLEVQLALCSDQSLLFLIFRNICAAVHRNNIFGRIPTAGCETQQKNLKKSLFMPPLYPPSAACARTSSTYLINVTQFSADWLIRCLEDYLIKQIN